LPISGSEVGNALLIVVDNLAIEPDEARIVRRKDRIVANGRSGGRVQGIGTKVVEPKSQVVAATARVTDQAASSLGTKDSTKTGNDCRDRRFRDASERSDLARSVITTISKDGTNASRSSGATIRTTTTTTRSDGSSGGNRGSSRGRQKTRITTRSLDEVNAEANPVTDLFGINRTGMLPKLDRTMAKIALKIELEKTILVIGIGAKSGHAIRRGRNRSKARTIRADKANDGLAKTIVAATARDGNQSINRRLGIGIPRNRHRNIASGKVASIDVDVKTARLIDGRASGNKRAANLANFLKTVFTDENRRDNLTTRNAVVSDDRRIGDNLPMVAKSVVIALGMGIDASVAQGKDDGRDCQIDNLKLDAELAGLDHVGNRNGSGAGRHGFSVCLDSLYRLPRKTKRVN